MKINKHVRGNYYTKFKGKFIYGATPEEVDEKYTELKHHMYQGYNIDKNPLLRDYMILWYNTHKKGKKSLKTQEMYRNCINNHINPTIGHKRLKEIAATEVQALLNGITSSKSLAHKVRITLNQIFKQSIADGIRSTNPVIACEVIAPNKPKRKCLTRTQRELLLEILKDHRMHPLIFIMLYTGMRRGESLALTWHDIDCENRVIKVTKALEYEKSKPIQKAPKTENGIRDIPIPDELLNRLNEWKKVKRGLYVLPGHAGGIMGLSELNKQWISAKNKIDKWFDNNEKAQDSNKKVGVERFNLTCRLLRHTYCTALFDAGIDEVSAADLMGHDVNIMREIYTHISEDRKSRTVAKINTLYKAPKRSKKGNEAVN